MAAKEKKADVGCKPIYVICGKDKFLVGGECERLVDELMPVEQRAMGLYQPRSNDVIVADVLDELRTLPFLAERRVVLLKDAGDFISANRTVLEAYFDSPSPTGVLILIVESWPKNTRLAKKLLRTGSLLDVGAIKVWELPKYVGDYVRQKHAKNFARGAAEIMVEVVGDDPGKLCREADKLAVYTGEQKNITTDNVEKLVGHNRMFNVFAVIDAITAGDVNGAIGRLRNMFTTDKSAEFTVVGAFAFHFRRMFAAKQLMNDGIGVNQIAGKLRIWGNKDAFFRQLKRMSLERIGEFLGQLAWIDYSIKTGRAHAKVAIEQLVLAIKE